MRIALVPSAFWPSVGGVETLTRQLAHELAFSGDTVEVWTSQASGNDRPAVETLDEVLLRRFPFPLPAARPEALLRFPAGARAAFAMLDHACEELRPDLLHVICFGPNGAYATSLSKRRRVPLVVTLQGETVMDDHDVYDTSATLRWALRRGLRQARVVTGCSRFTLDDAARFGLAQGSGSVVFNGTVIDETAPEPVELPFKQYILCLGRVVEKKGFDLLMRAFARLKGDRPDLGLVVAGEGRELPRLRALSSELALGDQVRFTGVLDRGAVATVMRGAAVFVMPSRVEPFGIVALEGWRAGVPVIVSSRGGAGEFVREGIDGLVVDPFDAAALADAMTKLLDDPELASNLTTSGSQRLPEFLWPRIVEQYRGLYATAVAGPVLRAGPTG